jgi:hypothetical protein
MWVLLKQTLMLYKERKVLSNLLVCIEEGIEGFSPIFGNLKND